MNIKAICKSDYFNLKINVKKSPKGAFFVPNFFSITNTNHIFEA